MLAITFAGCHCPIGLKGLNIVGFLDPPLHCNKFAAKAVSWFKPKKNVYVYLHALGESI